MNTITIREKLHNYLEVAEDKKLAAIYTMLEEDIKQQENFVLNEQQLSLLSDEREKHINQKTKSYNWDEAKAIIRNKKQ